MNVKMFERRIGDLKQQLRILILQNAREEDFDSDVLIKLHALSREVLQLKEAISEARRQPLKMDQRHPVYN